MADGLAQVVEKVVSEIQSMFKLENGTTGSFTEPVLAFIHAVDWSEPWIIGLLAFHVLLLVFAIRTRTHTEIQMATYIFGIAGVYFAENLNWYLARHWKSFARQPYFDRHGVFISTMWSGPLLLITCLILVNNMITLAKVLVQWKRAELRYRARLAQQKTD